MKRLLLATALSLLTAGSAMAQTVVLVRHAEKVDASADPVLSEAGQARAEALSQALVDFHPDHVFTSPLQRTRLTAAPTAAHHSVTPEAFAFEGGTAGHVAAIAARIQSYPDDTVVLVVGHSNTIPLIARALGYAEAADMADCEYDRLTVLDLDGAQATGVVTRYGAPTTCE
ncbi:SixA phosphatase family protein [Phenylobacterium sp.]|uniref:SixA phosphatase family protein n=1 Tax=Phenylobacterium sp. TaxID=1871053 RepID=UPI003983BC49